MSDYKKLVFVDTETTGGNFQNDRIIDIGIIRVVDGIVEKRFETLIDPGQPVPQFICQMTGIKLEELSRAPTFRQVAEEIQDLFQDALFVAHNSRFDYGLLRSEFNRIGVNFKMKQLCTVKLSRALRPEEIKHNLDAVIERYSLECEARHRAMPDAKAVHDFFFKAWEMYGEDKMNKAIKIAMKHPNLPAALDEDQIEDLPEEPGVYIFYGLDQIPIYIGKSVNIKERVKSHFSDANRIQTEMVLAQNVTNIETIITGGELGALLKETDLIKKEKPIYNKMLREVKKLVFLTATHVGKYKSIKMIMGEWPEGEVMGVFKNQTRAKEFLAKRIKKFKLCKKIMGWEKMRQTCFDRELGKCRGACEEKEDPVKYNMRFDMAFADSKVKAWPFGGPIIIQENKDNHVFDRWCYLGAFKNEDEPDYQTELPEMHFDLDTYKILISYINKRNNWKKIKVVTSK